MHIRDRNDYVLVDNYNKNKHFSFMKTSQAEENQVTDHLRYEGCVQVLTDILDQCVF